MRSVRIFEILVGVLVIGVVVCFCVELSKVNISDPGNLFRGFLPSKVLVEGQGYVCLGANDFSLLTDDIVYSKLVVSSEPQ